jgi:peptide/nickel transport system substrate-binding protein
VKDLLDKGDNSVDPKARKAAYKNALSSIANKAHALPLWSIPVYYVAAKDLNLKTYPDEVLRFWEFTWK